MNFICENTRILIPEIFDYLTHYETAVDWPYILMSKASGVSPESLEQFELTISQQSKIMQGLANVLYQLLTV